MVVGFTTTYAISAYHHWCFEFESQSGRGACTTLCDKVCQWLATGRWFFPGPPVSSTNKTDRHDLSGNTVESDVKHHQTTKQNQTCIYKRRGNTEWTIQRHWLQWAHQATRGRQTKNKQTSQHKKLKRGATRTSQKTGTHLLVKG